MRRPLVVAALIFAMELAYFAIKLVPTSYGIMADGGAAATALAEQGSALYHFALTVTDFDSAALLLGTSEYLLARGVRARIKNRGESAPRALVNLFRRSPAQAGGYLCHRGVARAVRGLVGSMM